MKKGTKRKILFIALGIILLLGITAFILAKTGVFVKQFKSIIEIELTKALNREVIIEKIEGGIFDSIDLINVRIASKKEIKDGVLIAIDKVSVKYNFRDIILNKKQVIESLKGIELIRPSVLIEKDEQGSWNIIDFINSLPVAENPVFPEKLPITVSKGLIGIKDSKKKFNSSLRNIYGSMKFTGQGKVSIKAGSKSFSSRKTNIYVDGLIDLKNKTNALILTGSDLELSHYAAYALTYLPPDKNEILSVKDGKFDFLAKISSEDISADLLIKKGEVGFKHLKTGLSGIISEISLSKESIKIKKFASIFKNSSIIAKGEIKNAFEGKPEGKLSVYLNRADLSDLGEEEIFKGLNPSGICNAGITIEGLFASPSVNVFANVRALRIAGFKTDNNELVLRYKDKKAVIENLKINAFDGLAKLSGSYDLDKDNLSLAGNASDMQFGEIFNTVGISGATGKAFFSIEAKGPLRDLTISSKVNVKKAALVSGALGDITGSLLFYGSNKLRVNVISAEKISMQTVFTFEKNKTFTDGFIKLSGMNFKNAYGFFVENKMELGGESTAVFSLKGPLEDITLSGDIAINNFNFEGYKARTAKGNLTIKRGLLAGSGLYFDQDGTGCLKADGSMGLAGDLPLNLTVSASKVDFSKIPVFNTYYKMSGRGAFAGKILGNISYPKFIATLVSDNMILDGKESLKADLSFIYNNSTLKIDKLNIDNEYTFNGEITFLNKTHLDSNLTVKDGKLSTLFTIFKIFRDKDEVKGTLNGGLRLSGDFESLNGEGELNTQNASAFGKTVDLFGLKFEVKNSIFTVKSFDFGMENIVLTAGGTISLKKNGPSSLDFKMSNTVNKNKITGIYNISAAGLFDPENPVIQAKIKSNALSFNEQRVDNITSDISYDKKQKKLTFVDFEWENLTGKAEYTFKNSGFLADLEFKASDFRKISFLNLEAKNTFVAGKLDGSMEIKTDKNGNITVKTGNENPLDILNLQYGDFKANRIRAVFDLEKSQKGCEIVLSAFQISQEKGTLNVEGLIKSDSEGFSPEKTDCRLKVFLSGADVKNLLPLIKSKADISAELLSPEGITITGKLSAPLVSGLLSARNVRSGSLLLGDFNGEFDYKNSVLNFRNLNFDDFRLDNHAEFKKAVFIFKKDYVEAQISAAADFKQFFGLRLKADVETNNFKLVSGENAAVESELSLKNFTMNDYKMNDLAFRLISSKTGLKLQNYSDYQGNTSTVKGEIVFKDKDSVEFKEVLLSIYDNTPGLVKINGVLGPVSNMVIDVNNTNVKFILKYFDLDFNMTGTVNNARVLYKGSADSPNVNIGGALRDVNIFNMAFSSVTGDMSFAGNKMTLSQVVGEQRIASKIQYQVKVDGTIPLNQEEEQDLHIVLNNAGLQPIMITGWFNNVEGIMDADLKIKGKLSYPEIEKGFLIIRGGSKLFPAGFIKEADNVKARFTIAKNRVTINNLSFEVDKSPVEVFGEFTLKKFYPEELINIRVRNRQTAERKGIKFKIDSIMNNEGTMSVKGDKDEYFSITGKSPKFAMKGELHIYDTGFTWPPSYKEGETAPRILKEMDWNLKVVIEESVWYYNTYCKAKLKTGSIITSAGPGGDLEMRGGAEINEGFLTFAGVKFNLKTASFVFLQNEKRNPAITASGEYNTSTHKVFLSIKGKEGLYAELGNGKNFDAVLTSQPEESQDQIIKIISGLTDLTADNARDKLIAMFAFQVINERLRDIVGDVFDVDITRRAGSRYHSEDLVIASEKTVNILDEMQFSVSKVIAENLKIRGTLYKDYDLKTSSLVYAYLTEVSVELASGNRKYNIALNPNEWKVGVQAVIPFDNEPFIEQEKNKKKRKEK
ncbi:MAG: translocation/assembly module TamB domain-containing protein [Candidatus Firestonebacteria bacterium]